MEIEYIHWDNGESETCWHGEGKKTLMTMVPIGWSESTLDSKTKNIFGMPTGELWPTSLADCANRSAWADFPVYADQSDGYGCVLQTFGYY